MTLCKSTDINGVNVIEGVRNVYPREFWIVVHERKVMLEDQRRHGVTKTFYTYKPLGLLF